VIRRVHIVVALLVFSLAASINAMAATKRVSTKKPAKSAKSSKTVRVTKTSKTSKKKASKTVRAKRVVRAKRSAKVVRTRRSRRARRARIRRLVWNPLFRGSREMLVRQNLQIDELALPRIADDEELEMRIAAGELVPLEDSQFLTVASNLKENRRYCRPWTRDFLEDLSEDFYAEFHKPLVITSLVRTAEQQRKLRRTNRNAAPEDGETVSTHLTGMTFDLLKRGLTRKQHKWIEQYFMPLKELGLVEPIEERRQPVFHVTVFNGYTEWADQQDAEDETIETPTTLTGAQSISGMRNTMEPAKPLVIPSLSTVSEGSEVAAN